MSDFRKTNLVIFGFSNDYGKMDVESLSRQYNVIHVLIPQLLLSVLIRLRLLSKSSFEFLVMKFFYFKLKELKGDWIAISIDNYVYSLALKLDMPCVKRKILFFRNTYNTESINLNFKDHVEFYSFDEDDCFNYGFNYYEQYCSGAFYLNEHCRNGVSNEIDFYFLGLDKGRRPELLKLSNALKQYNNQIIIIDDATSFIQKLQKKLLKRKNYLFISYAHHLENIVNSKVVIDFVKEGQVGITMRTLEAVIAKKKLITNNPIITKQPYYNNTMILFVDSVNDLSLKDVSVFISLSFEESKFAQQKFNDYSVLGVFDEII